MEPQQEGDIEQAIQNLPKCTIRSFLQTHRFSGFYRNDEWVPPYCRLLPPANWNQIPKCMSNKQWYLYGDSTIRQLYTFLVKHFNMTTTRIFTHDDWGNSADAELDDFNISLHFEFHDVPISHSIWFNRTVVRPASLFLNSLPADKEMVVIFSLWAHYTHFPLSFYRMHIESIINAAERLLKRNPTATVILKSANTRPNTDYKDRLLTGNWYARQMVEAVRELLADHPNIGYLDVWETTCAQLQREHIHPADPHTDNMLRMVISKSCAN